MLARSYAASPTATSKNLAQPQIHETAHVHSFSHIVGDVYIGANVIVAPGTSIRADEGTPFHVGEGSNVHDGVIIHGLEQGRVVGDNQQQYSVWIGKNTTITHLSLIYGPAYVGDDCFIGFRSTIFNARVGKGCIVMMHVLIQDVEIPPGKYVPSGSVITTQQQADRLPDVQSTSVEFAAHVDVNDALRSGYPRADDTACIATIRSELEQAYEATTNQSNSDFTPDYQGQGNMASDVVDQVRHLLAQGYRIGTEHADKRRFQTSSWQTCTPIQATRESEVLGELNRCLAAHSGEYVRLFGIDPKAKRRVSEIIVQRPDDKAPVLSASGDRSTASYTPSHAPSSYSNSSDSSMTEQVRNLLRQGYRIGVEYADKRRFQTSSWTSCPPAQSSRESDVIAAVERCLAEHQGEYVRIFGIDTQTKRRVGEAIVQRPGDRSGGGSSAAASAPAYSSSNGSASYSQPPSSSYGGASSLGSDAIEQVRGLVRQGFRIGMEHADKRRFQTSSWTSCSPIDSTRESEVIAALEACIAEHPREYVRIFGIDTRSKRRVGETIVQRP